MLILIILSGFLIGALVNALADSLPLKRKLMLPHCHQCESPRPWRAWISWLGLLTGAGRCDVCGERIRLRSLLVELAAVGGVVWLYLVDSSPGAFLPAVFVLAVFLLITITDLEHRLILHAVTGPSAVVMTLIGILDPARGLQKTLLGGAAGFVFFLGLYYLGALLAKLIARRRGQEIDEVAFGFGDVTLAGLIGLTVGWPGVASALIAGMLVAGLFSLLFILTMLAMRRYTPFMPIPYGPFLILGAAFIYVLQYLQ